MKNILNISVIAALAILPMAANATPTIGTIPAEPVDATANTNVASTSFVRGAYNAAVAVANAENARAVGVEGNLGNLNTTDKTSLVGAINSLAGATVKGVKVNGTGLTPDSEGKVNVTVAEGATNGTVAVNGTDVAVHGLKGAAYLDANQIATQAGTYDDTTSQIGQTTIQGAIQALDSTVDGLTTGTTVSDGNYIRAANTVAGNLGALDTQVKTNADNITTLNSADTVAGSVANTVKTTAANATYDNTTSGLTGDTLQEAIDEVAASVATQGAKVLKVYTTWNTNDNQEVTLTAPTPVTPEP